MIFENHLTNLDVYSNTWSQLDRIRTDIEFARLFCSTFIRGHLLLFKFFILECPILLFIGQLTTKINKYLRMYIFTQFLYLIWRSANLQSYYYIGIFS